jgi:Domain of unknown function (DUF1905)
MNPEDTDDTSFETSSYNGEVLLEKFPGKGGWTFARVPVQFPKSDKPFGWLVVSGKIDDLYFEHIKLMPAGDGTLFLPVKAAWRKILKKEAGTIVRIELTVDKTPETLPAEALELLRLFPGTFDCFQDLKPEIRRDWLEKIESAVKTPRYEAVLSDFVEFLQKHLTTPNG